MKTLPMLMVAMLLGASSAAAVAGEDSAVATITVTAKRAPSTAAPAERTPPKASVEIPAPLPTDMPEMEIDSHMTPIHVAAAPAVAHVAL